MFQGFQYEEEKKWDHLFFKFNDVLRGRLNHVLIMF